MLTALALVQALALALLVARLGSGRARRPPIVPLPEGRTGTAVSVLLPAYNEASRIGPCLDGLVRQGPPLSEVIVIDSGSADGTGRVVLDAAQRDDRVRLVRDPPLPPGWVGKVWALQHGLAQATGDWILGVDADTRPRDGMVAAVVSAAVAHGYDAVSFSPRFVGMSTSEQWLQPSMLLTLVYRFGAVGIDDPPPHRLLANGQCYLARRDVLLAHGGYAPARASWADDVSLSRHLAARGHRVGFLDGSRLYDVLAYEGLGQVWREWGRSFDLRDATGRVKQWSDVAFIALVQGLPVPLLLATLAGAVVPRVTVIGVNGALLVIRTLMLAALGGSYDRRTVGYWLSPFSDPLAALRLLVSTFRRPTSWRGRSFLPEG